MLNIKYVVSGRNPQLFSLQFALNIEARCPAFQRVHHNGQCTLLVISKVSFELPFVECDIVSFQDKTEVHCACHILLKLGFYEFHLWGTDFD